MESDFASILVTLLISNFANASVLLAERNCNLAINLGDMIDYDFVAKAKDVLASKNYIVTNEDVSMDEFLLDEEFLFSFECSSIATTRSWIRFKCSIV